MKIGIKEIAKELFMIDSINPFSGGRNQGWSDLPFHRKLTYKCEARRITKAVNNAKKRKIKNEPPN